jgi:hypothetical protein
MDPIADTSADAQARLETLVQQTRDKLLDGVEQLIMRQMDPVLERTQKMLLGSTEAIVREQAEPLLARLRQVLLEALSEAAQRQLEPLAQRIHQTTLRVVEEVIQKHAAPLVAQVRVALQESMEEVVKRQMAPMLDRARQSMQESVGITAQLADVIVARLKVTVAEPGAQMFREEVPRYAQWLGRRTLDYVLAATLFCLAAVFLLIGSVFGLEEVGLKPFVSYIVGGLAAVAGGLVFLRVFTSALPPQPPGPAPANRMDQVAGGPGPR